MHMKEVYYEELVPFINSGMLGFRRA